MAALPTITVVTPSLNQGRFLDAAIRSVLSQGYPNLEYVVVDGGSTDESVDIIRRYEDRLHAWISEPDGGQYDAIRKGEADATVSQPADLYAKYGLEYLKEAMAGKVFKPGPTDHDSRIEMFNGNPMDLLPAPVVTKANVDDPKLWANNVKG